MCHQVGLTPLADRLNNVEQVLRELRASHLNGGALFGQFRVGESAIFDWFASRNRFAEYSILPSLLRRKEVQEFIPELLIPSEIMSASSGCSSAEADGFSMENPFLLDGRIAGALYAGGAYGQSTLDASAAKQLALAFCQQLFEQRYDELAVFNSFAAWTACFRGIAWDWTAFVFDRRKRTFSILALTDTD